jgi:hypothetical protein
VHRFNVPRTTLRDRLHGHQNRGEARANNQKLTQTEEELIKKWILSMDSRGAAPRPATIQEMGGSITCYAWIYLGSTSRRELGLKLCEKAPGAFNLILKAL